MQAPTGEGTGPGEAAGGPGLGGRLPGVQKPLEDGKRGELTAVSGSSCAAWPQGSGGSSPLSGGRAGPTRLGWGRRWRGQWWVGWAWAGPSPPRGRGGPERQDRVEDPILSPSLHSPAWRGQGSPRWRHERGHLWKVCRVGTGVRAHIQMFQVGALPGSPNPERGHCRGQRDGWTQAPCSITPSLLPHTFCSPTPRRPPGSWLRLCSRRPAAPGGRVSQGWAWTRAASRVPADPARPQPSAAGHAKGGCREGWGGQEGTGSKAQTW